MKVLKTLALVAASAAVTVFVTNKLTNGAVLDAMSDVYHNIVDKSEDVVEAVADTAETVADAAAEMAEG